jgi:hypothetical protein
MLFYVRVKHTFERPREAYLKASRKTLLVQAKNAYKGNGGQLLLLLKSTLGGERSALGFGPFTTGKIAPYPLNRRLCGLHKFFLPRPERRITRSAAQSLYRRSQPGCVHFSFLQSDQTLRGLRQPVKSQFSVWPGQL